MHFLFYCFLVAVFHIPVDGCPEPLIVTYFWFPPKDLRCRGQVSCPGRDSLGFRCVSKYFFGTPLHDLEDFLNGLVYRYPVGSPCIHRASVEYIAARKHHGIDDILNMCEVTVLFARAPNLVWVHLDEGFGDQRYDGVGLVLPGPVSCEDSNRGCLHPILFMVCPECHLAHKLGPTIL